MKKVIAIILTLLLALTAGAGVYYFLIYQKSRASGSGRVSSTSDNAVYVDSVKIIAGLESGTGQIPRFAGVVEPQETWEAKLESDKTVKTTYVKEGDEVKAGDKLFTYDTAEDEEKLAQAQIELERNESDLDNKKFQLESWEKQKPKDDATDEVKLEYTATLLQYQTDVKSTEYDIKQGKQEIEQLQNTLNSADVLCELDGVVKKISNPNSSNNYYSSDSSDAYITVMAVGDFRIKGTLNEQNLGDMDTGEEVLVFSRVDSQVWKGTISEINTDSGESNQTDSYYYGGGGEENSTNYPFYVKLDNSDGLLLGQHVYIEPDEGQSERRDGIWIPDYYFEFDEDGGGLLWTASRDNKLERRQVQVGEYDGNLESYQVLSGLDADDFITVPDDSLQEGQPVIYVEYGNGLEEDEDLYADAGSYDYEDFDDGSFYADGLEQIWYDDGSYYDEDVWYDDGSYYDEDVWYDDGSYYDEEVWYDEGSFDDEDYDVTYGSDGEGEEYDDGTYVWPDTAGVGDAQADAKTPGRKQ